MTTFFTPSGANVSGWQRVGTDISMITTTDRLLVGLSTTDFDINEKFIVHNDIYCVSSATNAISVGLSSVGGVASIVATATGAGTPPDLLFYVPSERMRLTHSSGQLGIGITAPTAQIHVKEAADGYGAKFERNAGAIVGVNLTTTTAAIGTITAHTLTLTTNSVNAIFIDTAQKVGIGNTAPVTTLGVTGTVSCTGNLNIGSLAVGGAPLTVVGNNTMAAFLATTLNNVTFSTNSNDLHFSVVDAGAVTINTLTGDLKIGAGAINAFTIFAANGHAQVGDSTDRGFAFYVNGSSKYNGAITYTNTITATDFTKQVSLGVTKFGSSAAIDASALVEMLSTTQGMLLPRMTTAQKNAISSPAEGLVVYDTTLHKACVRTAAAWETITSA